MIQTLQDQFDNIKKLIKLNIESINGLIKQADSLKTLIESVDSPLDEKSKTTLVEIRTSLVKSINDLIKHTDKLFTAYDDIIEKISSK